MQVLEFISQLLVDSLQRFHLLVGHLHLSVQISYVFAQLLSLRL